MGMSFYRLTLSIILTLIMTYAFSQCPGGQQEVRIQIQLDQYWYECTWDITNIDNSIVYASGGCQNDTLQTFTYCIPDSICAVFHIKDSYGDGIYPSGFYRLYVNGNLIHANYGGDYHFGEFVRWGCLPGTICENPIQIDTGIHQTLNARNSWYIFSPADTGTYLLSTCLPGNSCPSKIWVYDHCNGFYPNDDQTGANFYAAGECINGAKSTIYLAGGHSYYIRIGVSTDTCGYPPLNFSLQYQGPVLGCKDPLACNYNPLATKTDTCVYGDSPLCTHYADLKVVQEELVSSLSLNLLVNSDACTVTEGCLRGLGNRYVLRFTTHIQNIGDADYYIGPTPSDQNEPTTQFVWDPCHHHWHYRGYAEYLLYNHNGGLIPIGSKNGFCVLDLVCENGGIGKYSCTNMGITAGCADKYDQSLPCQWIDITGIPPGTYTMVVRVNWAQKPDKLGRVEKNYLNNWAQACFNLSYDGNQPVVDFLENDCPPFVDCSGIPYGNSVTDCEGVCGGPAIQGDLNKDGMRNSTDVEAYLNAALSGNPAASDCQDLFTDGTINVYDAALLQECNIHGMDTAYWYQRFPCQFPTGFANTQDVVYLVPGTLDTIAKTFDVQVVNPYNKLIGFEFSIDGLTIDHLSNLDANYHGMARFSPSGHIIALSADESTIKKNVLPEGLIRIHYKTLDKVQVCISSVTAIVNDKYQLSAGFIAPPACVSTGLVNTQAPQETLRTFIEPNPFVDKTTIYFSNPTSGPVQFTLRDLTGRIVRSYRDFHNDFVTLERGTLSSGIYLFELRTETGMAAGKVIAVDGGR
jgi:hypothetical protein